MCLYADLGLPSTEGFPLVCSGIGLLASKQARYFAQKKAN